MSLASENIGHLANLDDYQRAQAATSEILRVISKATSDPQPVFDLIAESATKLCGAEVCTVTRFDGEWVHLDAIFGSNSAGRSPAPHFPYATKRRGRRGARDPSMRG